jgi:hypothetical protein
MLLLLLLLLLLGQQQQQLLNQACGGRRRTRCPHCTMMRRHRGRWHQPCGAGAAVPAVWRVRQSGRAR